jgi:hypothetical protein
MGENIDAPCKRRGAEGGALPGESAPSPEAAAAAAAKVEREAAPTVFAAAAGEALMASKPALLRLTADKERTNGNEPVFGKGARAAPNPRPMDDAAAEEAAEG